MVLVIDEWIPESESRIDCQWGDVEQAGEILALAALGNIPRFKQSIIEVCR